MVYRRIITLRLTPARMRIEPVNTVRKGEDEI